MPTVRHNESPSDASKRVIAQGGDLAVRDALLKAHNQAIDWRWWMPDTESQDDPDALIAFMKVITAHAANVMETTITELIREGLRYKTQPDDLDKAYLKDMAFSYLMIRMSVAKTNVEMIEHMQTLDLNPIHQLLMETGQRLVNSMLTTTSDAETVQTEAQSIVDTVINSLRRYWEGTS